MKKRLQIVKVLDKIECAYDIQLTLIELLQPIRNSMTTLTERRLAAGGKLDPRRDGPSKSRHIEESTGPAAHVSNANPGL